MFITLHLAANALLLRPQRACAFASQAMEGSMPAAGNSQPNQPSPKPAAVPLLDIARENGPLQAELEQALVEVAREART